MKTIPVALTLCFCLVAAIGCQDLILIPAKGNVEGHVKDNNGTPLAGVQVSATFDAPSENVEVQPFANTVTAVTDNDGYFRVKDVWDEVTVTIDQSGFLPVLIWLDMNENNRPILDLTLNGSPTIGILTLSKTTLASDSLDTIAIRIEVKDVYNLNAGAGYTVNFFLKTITGAIMTILPASLHSQSLQQYLFDALLLSGDDPKGTYRLEAEVQDPDGNIQQVDFGQDIIIE